MRDLKVVLFVLLVAIVTNLSNIEAKGLNFGLQGIGGHIGYVMPEDPIENTIDFGVQADVGNYNNKFFFTAFVDYWSKSYDYTYYEWSYSVTTIGIYGKYYFKEMGSFKPYTGAGLDFVISSWDSKYTGPDYGYGYTGLSYSDSDSDIGFDLIGGAEKNIKENLKLYFEAKYHIGGIDQFVLNVGITYLLGKK